MSAPSSAAVAGAGGASADADASAARAAQAEQAAQIARALEALDTLFASERRHLHPQLTHFLQNRSYAKALAFLGGPEGGIPPTARKQPRPTSTAANSTTIPDAGTSTRAADNAADNADVAAS